jgi:cytochrome c biogenesis protein CcdA
MFSRVGMTTTPGQEQASTRAVLALVFGILGVVHLLPCASPIAAIVLGTGEPSGVAKAGVILGWITLAQYALAAAVLLLLLLVGGVAALPFVD